MDSNLVNGTKYCYKAKSTGSRVVETQTYSTTNWSHISCGIPQDTIPPCQPPFDISDSCSKFFLTIRWHKPLCAQDAIKYNLYYSPTLNTEATIVATIPNPNDSVYIYRPASETYLKGCFYITGIDSFNNESRVSTIKCSDVCFEYSLPNFFSPNNDGVDDTFMPINSAFVKKVDMKIYNRWGILVYETTDPQINWDGRFYKNSQVLPTGIYYYVCVVYEDRLAGQTVRPLTGFIHLVSDPIANQQPIKE